MTTATHSRTSPEPRAQTPRIVVIGAGIVGCALADELTARGHTDVTVLDQGPLYLTGGSTSHAPGLVFQTSGTKVMTDFARYTVDKYTQLSDDAGRPCFAQVGGLELAATPERLDELHRRCGWARSWGVEAHVLTPEECAEIHPLVETDQILGGLHLPTDGVANAVGAAAVQANSAIQRGARFLAHQEVVDVELVEDRVDAVVTTTDRFPADLVVSCAGMWGPLVTRMVGMQLPLIPLAHQLAWTGAVPTLSADPAAHQSLVRHPILRYQEQDLYYREHFDQVVVGYYGHRPMPVDPAAIGGAPSPASSAPDKLAAMPSVQDFTAEDFAPAWEDSRALLPGLAETKIEEGINGLFSFTPDNMPLIGASANVEGFWVAEAVWITHSAGVARAVAERIVDGESTFDLHGCDITRFQPHQLAPDFVHERGCQNFVEVYDAMHPLQPMESPRPLRTSPFYQRERDLGAFFLEASGWERPHWYESNAGLTAQYPAPDLGPWARRYWSPIIAAEAQATREHVAMYDMSSLMRLEVSGPGAAAFLQYMTTGKVDRVPGAVTYTLLLDTFGRLRGDITVARVTHDTFQLGVNSPLDLYWLRNHAPSDGTVQIRDLTPGTTCIGLWGPQARELLTPLADHDLTNTGLRYFRCARFNIANVPVFAMRVSYVGELGWELYTTTEHGLGLWDTLWRAGQEHGIIAAGRGAFNSLRLEKGYRAFGADMTDEHDPYAAGVGFAVKLDKGDFLGRAALEERAEQPPQQRLVCLTYPRPADTVMGSEPVYAPGGSDTAIGYVTSSAYGYTLDTGIAYAWVPAELAEPDTSVDIGYFDRLVRATVTPDPLFDPAMERLRV